jgi:hypothetical protein
MNCPHCQSPEIKKLPTLTDLGYGRFQCRSCRRTFNERTGTPFNFLEMPTDIVFQVVLFRLLFKLSLRDLMRICQIWFFRGRRVPGLKLPRPGKPLKTEETVPAEKAPWVKLCR